MKLKILIITLFLSTLLVGCYSSSTGSFDQYQLLPSPIPILEGEWRGDYFPASTSTRYYYTYIFHRNSIIDYYSYSVSGDIYKTDDVEYQWKKGEKGEYYYKPTDNEFSSWELFDIKIINNNQIIIEGITLDRQ